MWSMRANITTHPWNQPLSGGLFQPNKMIRNLETYFIGGNNCWWFSRVYTQTSKSFEFQSHKHWIIVFFFRKKNHPFWSDFSSRTRKLIERLREEDAVASRQFADEASAFASANPRVDLGRETSSKVAVKSIETWEMIPERLSTIIWRCFKKWENLYNSHHNVVGNWVSSIVLYCFKILRHTHMTAEPKIHCWFVHKESRV